MTDVCRICLEPSELRYHPRCLEQLFGRSELPAVDIDRAKLHTVALAMVGKTTLSGVQRKVSLGLSADRLTLRVSVEGTQYVLKPASDVFPELPLNELLTMRIAQRAGVEIPPCGLVPLADGSEAYIVRRFDRDDLGKLRQEDFCQLTETPPADKYSGSAERCAKVVRAFATEPGVELARLFRWSVVSWWLGNGDLHLKNFSLLCGRDGRTRLSPAYDLVCTQLYIPDDPLALPVGGLRSRLDRADWLRYGAYCGLPARLADRVCDEIAATREAAEALVETAPLSPELQQAYLTGLAERTRALVLAPPD